MNASCTQGIGTVLVRLDWAVLLYFLFVNLTHALLLASATREMRSYARRVRGETRWRVLGSRAAPRISILAPAYNEAVTIAASVRALLALNYSNLEVVVVNDGSAAATLEVLRERFELVPIHTFVWTRIRTEPVRKLYRSRTHPNLVVVDKENGGKADALNVGPNLASGDLVCAIDADTLVEPDSLQRMVRPFLMRDDMVAVGGTVRIVNGSRVEAGRVAATRLPRTPVAGIQAVEYLRAFLVGRLGWNRLGGNLIISGAFGLFRTDAVVSAGGAITLSVGAGREAESLGAAGVQITPVRSVGAWGSARDGERWDVVFGAGVHRQGELYTRTHLEAGLRLGM